MARMPDLTVNVHLRTDRNGTATAERRMTPQPYAEARIEHRDDGSKVIVGYGAVFFRKDDPGTEYEMGFLGLSIRERIMPGAFDRALREKDDVRGLFNHSVDNLLGRSSAGTMKLSVDKTGLRYEIPVDENDPDHQRVLAKIERGDLNGSSFLFLPDKEGVTWRETEDGDIRELHSVRLFDTGPVTFPAYEATTAGVRSADADEALKAEHDAWKRGRRRARIALGARKLDTQLTAELLD